MIDINSLREFVTAENNAAKEKISQLYEMSINERVELRKAINHVKIDYYYSAQKDEFIIRKAIVKQNISDFKIGEYLIIHQGSPSNPTAQCILYDILDDGSLLLGFNLYYKQVQNIDKIIEADKDAEFLLDKSIVDLLSLYLKGISCITTEAMSLVNNISKPTFYDNEQEYRQELSRTENKYNILLTENQREAILKAMLCKDYYMIQGPPGTGKSFVISMIIAELIKYKGERVIVCGPNHMAINNALLKTVTKFDFTRNNVFKIGQSFNNIGLKYTNVDGIELSVNHSERLKQIPSTIFENNLNNDCSGMAFGITPFHLYTSRWNNEICDTLIIDEAGQLNIPLALMAMSKAKRVIFVGDHKQLSPIIESEYINTGLTKSIFELLYRKDNCTTLNRTFRMNGPICNLISGTFYDNILKSGVAKNKLLHNDDEKLYSPNFPIILKEINHDCKNYSDIEADFCISTIKHFIINLNYNTSDIAIIAPFRAQCALIRKKLRAIRELIPNYTSIITDTVDRIQGQEREIIIISLTTGNLSYMNNLSNFIYNPNRMNVAFSRAKNKLIIVGNITNISRSAIGTSCKWLQNILTSPLITVLK